MLKNTVSKSFSLDMSIVQILYELKECKNLNISRFVNAAIREKIDNINWRDNNEY